MIKAIPLAKIRENPFNSRVNYADDAVRSIARSMKAIGLLEPIKVRENEGGGFYEIVFGHHRFRAAKLLKWKSISADVSSVSDKDMLVLSLSENIARNQLSDYEKGLAFLNLRRNFNLKYEEIGTLFGYSSAHACNYVRMAQLLDEDILSREPDLVSNLTKITERHSRELWKIENQMERARALRLVVSQGLSVSDTRRVLHKLGGLFESSDLGGTTRVDDSGPPSMVIEGSDATTTSFASPFDKKSIRIEEIRNAIFSIFKLPLKGDFRKFADLHSYGDGFSMYSEFPPFDRFSDEEALQKEREWFYKIAPRCTWRIRDLRIQLFRDTALATLYVDFEPTQGSQSETIHVRGTVVFVLKRDSWKILHEHWSNFS